MSVLSGDDPVAVDHAVRVLQQGGLIAMPTETVYGLGARADDDTAVAAIFSAKGRPADHPLIVHVADAQSSSYFCDAPGVEATRLMARHWPGPLTLIVARRDGRARAAAGGQSTIGLRCPAHPVAQALLRAALAAGVPGVAAPSANRFGRISPTRADHVVQEFGDALLVLDGGACAVGIESSIVDCTRSPPVLLRPGGLDRATLEQVLGAPMGNPDAASPRVSGSLASHYAPTARLRLWTSSALLRTLEGQPAASRPSVAVYSRQAVPAVCGAPWAAVRRMPDDARAAAHELFAVLRELDALGVDQIWVEQPPAGPAWDGVNDRLRRAAAA